ncbi:MAG: MoaD/ThiS family protein [Candidatus Neomarinimicrobiota bacterium]
MTDTISVKLVCHSVVKHALGSGELEVRLPVDATGADLEKHIREMAGGRLENVPFRLAVNRTFVSRDVVLSQGDEVSLIPPMQGG